VSRQAPVSHFGVPIVDLFEGSSDIASGMAVQRPSDNAPPLSLQEIPVSELPSSSGYPLIIYKSGSGYPRRGAGVAPSATDLLSSISAHSRCSLHEGSLFPAVTERGRLDDAVAFPSEFTTGLGSIAFRSHLSRPFPTRPDYPAGLQLE